MNNNLVVVEARKKRESFVRGKCFNGIAAFKCPTALRYDKLQGKKGARTARLVSRRQKPLRFVW